MQRHTISPSCTVELARDHTKMVEELQEVAQSWFDIKADMRTLATQTKELRKKLKTTEQTLMPLLEASESRSITIDGKKLSLQSRLQEG